MSRFCANMPFGLRHLSILGSWGLMKVSGTDALRLLREDGRVLRAVSNPVSVDQPQAPDDQSRAPWD